MAAFFAELSAFVQYKRPNICFKNQKVWVDYRNWAKNKHSALSGIGQVKLIILNICYECSSGLSSESSKSLRADKKIHVSSSSPKQLW